LKIRLLQFIFFVASMLCLSDLLAGHSQPDEG
jgi:hypothetical protein